MDLCFQLCTADEDFTLTTETVTFDPGVSFASVLVPILDDAIREEVEMFEVVGCNHSSL